MYRASTISNPAKFARIAKLASDTDYNVEFRPTRYDRGWPTASAKPYLLQFADGGHIASFATLEQLERNLRARNGC